MPNVMELKGITKVYGEKVKNTSLVWVLIWPLNQAHLMPSLVKVVQVNQL